MRKIALLVTMALAMTCVLLAPRQAGASVHRIFATGSTASTIVNAANVVAPDTLQASGTYNPAVAYWAPNLVAATTPAGLMSITLPTGNPSYQPGVMNGTMVLAGGQTASVLNQEVGGFQVAQVINSASSPMLYIYTMNFPAGYAMSQPDPTTGEIAITTNPSAPTPANSIGIVNPSWAVDANGTPVPSKYYVFGNQLWQNTTPSASTVFPVVADPHISFGNGLYVHFTHADSGRFMWINVAEGFTAALGSICLLTGPFAYFCGIIFGGLVNLVKYTITACYNRGAGSGIVFHLPLFSLNLQDEYCVGDDFS